jgi:aminoglycoside/choline kinase family phosphotransferase
MSDLIPQNPQQIDISRHFYDAFGHIESEISARWIVRFCQKKGNWEPFTKEEIEEFYNAGGFVDFRFNHLISGRWIDERDGKYHITQAFLNCLPKLPG